MALDNPKRLRLLKVTKAGYLVGSGGRQSTEVLIPHEALVAVLTGLLEEKARQAEAVPTSRDDPVALSALIDACRYARRLVQGVAWRLGLCSWDRSHRAIP